MPNECEMCKLLLLESLEAMTVAFGNGDTEAIREAYYAARDVVRIAKEKEE
jgi:hypothetical protein